MKKKLLAMLVLSLTLTASVGLAGCFDTANSSSNSDSTNSESSIPEGDSSSGDDSSSQAPVIATFTVTFNSDGGSAVDAQTIDEGETATKPTDPTKAGYTFAGWTLNGEAYDFTTPVSSDIQLVATWAKDAVKYTVTFNSDGGSTVAAQEIVENSLASEPVAPTKTGYKFAGWLLDGEAYDFTSAVTGNIELTAKWIALYTVSFNSDGGSAVDAQTLEENQTATEPTVPTKANYKFGGWLLNGEAYDFATPVTGNIELTAKWIALYTVSFNSNGGSTVESQTIEENEVVSEPTAPTKDDCKFGGWLLNGEAYDFATPVTGDIELTAKWIAGYAVTFNSDGGSAVETQDVDEGQTVSEPTAPTKMGYVFAGWTLNGEAYNFATPITGDIELVAVWAPKTDTAYKFEVYAEELDGSYKHLVTYDRTGTTGADISLDNADLTLIPEGFEFDSDNENNIISGTIAADGSSVLKAYINRISFEVKYYDYDLGLLYTESVKYECAAVYAEQPTRDSDENGFYVFNGWATEQNGSTVVDLSRVVEGISVYATYTVKGVLVNGATSAWSDPASVSSSNDYVYGAQTDSTKVGFKPGYKYANLIVSVANTTDVGYIEFFISNTTGKALEIFTETSLEATGGAVISIPADAEWKFVRLEVAAVSEQTLYIRGAGESIVNENDIAYFYISNLATAEVTHTITGSNEAWVNPVEVSTSNNYVYGEETASTKIGFNIGYKYANFAITLLEPGAAYVEFYFKNTTGKTLEIYTEQSLVENNGNTTSISADTEWQLIRLAVDRTKAKQWIYLRGAGESVINDSEVAYVYVSKITDIEPKTTISAVGSGYWQEPESVSASNDYVYAEETESTKIGFKVEYKYASFYVNLVEPGAAYIEFYIKNTTGKALEIFTDQSLSENGGAPYSISADAEWQLIRLAVDRTKAQQCIYLRGAGESVVSASDISYVYISKIVDIEPKTTISAVGAGAWQEPESVSASNDYIYAEETESTKIGFKVEYKYASFYVNLVEPGAAYIEFYIKNTTGKALEIFTDSSLVETGGAPYSVSADTEWQLIRLAVDRTKAQQCIYLRGAGESIVNESDVSYVYLSNVIEIEPKITISGLESGGWQEPASVTLSTEYVYGTETESTKIGFKAEYKYASFYVTLVEAGATHIEFYIKNTTGKALEIFTDQSLSENGGAPYSISADAEWKLIRLAINTTTNKQKIYLRGAGETVVTASEVAYVYISNVTEA